MILTSADIGTNPAIVEASLTDKFKTARRWGAVLLIDEADVFMERRGTADLERNSLVAGSPLYFRNPRTLLMALSLPEGSGVLRRNVVPDHQQSGSI